MPKPLMLSYRVPERELFRLFALGRKFRADVREITKKELTLPIAAIAGRLPPVREEKALKFPKEPLLVFINFPEGALDTFLEAMRKTGCCRGILKAVLTPANAVMTPGQLYEELAREREEMRKKS